VYNPFLLPDVIRNNIEKIGLSESISEFGAKDPGKGVHREQKTVSSRHPVLSIRCETTTRNQVMDVRVISEVTPPSMQNTHHANFAPDKTGITG
jgi:hypothetical protein